MSRRGRKRKPGPRGKTGRLLRVNPYDTGTEELQHHRRTLAGEKGDPRMTTTPLDVLRTRNLVTEPQWEAGCRLLSLRRGYPWPHASCMGMEVQIRGKAGESDREARAAERYREAVAELMRRCKPAAVSAVFNVCVTQEWDLLRDTRASSVRLDRLREGLLVLAWHFGMVREVHREAA